jgi:ribosomal protein S18 acetylase RimI-like enzyme
LSDLLGVFPISANDRARVAELVRATGVFRDEELDVAVELFDDAIGARASAEPGEADYTFLGAYTRGQELAGFACYGPTPDTDRTFDLYWLVVDPRLAGQGVGTLLLAEVEKRLAEKNARMVVAETSSRDDYDAARWFYAKRGYTEAGRVCDFYAWSDDRVFYTKRLTPARAGTVSSTAALEGVTTL